MFSFGRYVFAGAVREPDTATEGVPAGREFIF